MSSITTHVLDTTLGKPGSGMVVVLERMTHSAGWQKLAEGITDADGRLNDLLSPHEVFLPGHYRLIFETAPYWLLNNVEGFFPQVSVAFVVRDSMQHFHVPLLLSSYGYTTYRGS